MKVKCLKEFWSGKDAGFFYKGLEYDINPEEPYAEHFDFPKKEPELPIEESKKPKSKALDAILK